MKSELQRAVRLRKRGRLKSAIKLLSQLQKRNPMNPDVYYQLAWAYDISGQERKAVWPYIKSLELGLRKTERKSAYLGLGSTLRSLGDLKASRSVLLKGIREFPKNRPLRVFLALTERDLGNSKAAFKILMIELIETTRNTDLASYKRALLQYV